MFIGTPLESNHRGNQNRVLSEQHWCQSQEGSEGVLSEHHRSQVTEGTENGFVSENHWIQNTGGTEKSILSVHHYNESQGAPRTLFSHNTIGVKLQGE